ncbi:hypothetical protein ILUMI_02976, partial [Ignelater luminosus]
MSTELEKKFLLDMSQRQIHNNENKITTDADSFSYDEDNNVQNFSETTDCISESSTYEVLDNCSCNIYENDDSYINDIEVFHNSIPIDNSISNFTSSSIDNSTLRANIASWAIEHKIKHSALSDLLQILRRHPYGTKLPTDPRTLLKAPRSTIICAVKPDHYLHIIINISDEHPEYKDIIIKSFPLQKDEDVLKIETQLEEQPNFKDYMVNSHR